MRLSVIIPVFNEEATILAVLARVHAMTLEGFEKEVIVVDDGSTDGTRARLDSWSGLRTVLVECERNAGKGAAVRAGLLRATGDVVLIQDADLELDPADWPPMLAPILRGESDVVYGVRDYWRAKGSRWSTRAGNAFLSLCTSILFGRRVRDMETAYKAIRRPLLASIRLECNGFDFEPEITAKLLRLGHRIAQVPIRYEPRDVAHGKKMRAFREGLRALRTLLRVRAQSQASLTAVRIEAAPAARVSEAGRPGARA